MPAHHPTIIQPALALLTSDDWGAPPEPVPTIRQHPPAAVTPLPLPTDYNDFGQADMVLPDWLGTPGTAVPDPPVPTLPPVYPLVAGERCSKCGHPDLARRHYEWGGIVTSVCIRCGNDGFRQVAPPPMLDTA